MPPAYTMTAPSRGPAPPMMDYGQDPGADPTMAPLGQSTVQQMDPGSMSALFGDDQDSGADQATDQAQDAGDQGGVDQDKLQDVLSDPAMLQAVAQVLKTLGTGDDTDLVHVSEDEKTALKQGGGEGTTNPTTGLLQYAKSGFDSTDWYSMTPDDRVALIGQAAGLPPAWSNNWWTRPGATQGGMTRNMTGEDFANANVAVTPSWGTAMNMAGLIGGLAAGGPLGAIMSGLTRSGLSGLFGGSFGDAFSTPGGRLPPEAVAAVAAAYNDAVNRGLPTAQVMNAANTALASARGAYGGGPGGQPGGPGPGYSGGIGVDAAGNAYGTNIGGAGVSHNMMAGAAAAMAAANAARGFAAGGYGRAAPAGADGRGGGDVGGGGPSGGDRGGGLGGGAGNKGGGSNRSD